MNLEYFKNKFEGKTISCPSLNIKPFVVTEVVAIQHEGDKLHYFAKGQQNDNNLMLDQIHRPIVIC